MVSDEPNLAAENERLAREVRALHARVAAYETSRWWRLHPRRVFNRKAPETVAARGQHDHSASFPPDFSHDDREVWLRVAPYTMTTPSRVYALVRAVEYVVKRQIPGAFVECGVWKGGSMMAVALTLLRHGVTDRDLYLYDTFAGMTEPGGPDVRYSGEAASALLAELPLTSNEWAFAGIEEVRAAMGGVGYPEARIHFVQGPVEETLPARAPETIGLLRLDTDWYSSTKHELVHLYPRLASGGVLVIDDYGYWRGQQQAVDEYLAGNGITLLLNRIDAAARIAMKP